VSAIALCWHLAAMADPTRRDQFMQKLPNETLGLAVCVEAAGIAVQKGITWDKALREIHDSIGLSQAEELIPILTLSNPWLPSRGVRWT
jgi:hypothetical protein